jgi:hypothetical protein
MCRLFVVILSFIFISTGYPANSQSEDKVPQDEEEGIQISVPEGQFMSEPIEIFINQDITKAMNPKLILINMPLLGVKKKSEDAKFSPQVIARKQKKIVNNIESKGTILLFSLRQYPFQFYEILKQVKPVLIWNDPDDPEESHQAIGSPTNIGNDIPFLIFVIAIVGVCVSVIAIWSKRADKSALGLLLGNDGYLSLSRTQVAAWTIVVGGVVFGFGLLMLKVPNIPESLVALMGLSLATGGIKHYTGSKENPKDIKPRRFSLADLICEGGPESDTPKTSLPKAQMLFWTVLMLYLFIIKSIADGKLWEVPWEMVALMGMSQAAYLSPHLPGVRKKESASDPEDNSDAGEQK